MAMLLTGMDEEELMLVRACVGEPDDDLPRKVYADLLEKRGEFDQEELIRLQLERSGDPAAAPSARELALLGGETPRPVARKWFPSLRLVAGASVLFSRGFPECLHLRGRLTKPSGLAALFRELPLTTVWAHSFNNLAPVLEAAAGGLGLRRLLAEANRAASDYYRCWGAFSVLGAPCFDGLSRLELDGYPLSAIEVMAIGPLCGRGRIREMGLTRAALPAANLALLLPATASPGLRFLTLSRNWFGDAGAVALAGCPGVRGLAGLDLSDNQIGPDGAEALANSPNLAGLQVLDLGGNPLGAEGGRPTGRRHVPRRPAPPARGALRRGRPSGGITGAVRAGATLNACCVRQRAGLTLLAPQEDGHPHQPWQADHPVFALIRERPASAAPGVATGAPDTSGAAPPGHPPSPDPSAGRRPPTR